jgi:eukaryotic-like serine/threonine-protein kinase
MAAPDRKLVDHGVVFGPFVLERRIAVGGTAEVFLAHPKAGTAPAPRVVVKKLLPASGEGGRYNVLEKEADLHRHVRHPNVVTVYGAGMVQDEPYLAMEYVEGVDLYRLLSRLDAEAKDLTPSVAAFVAARIADALAAVHAARNAQGQPLNIVHRDVTPSNIYLSVKGDVKLGDFGIARIESPGQSAQPTVGLKGKLGYLAPEQVAGEAFDHRADLFALAALLGEMLIGERVFPGNGQLAVLLAIRDGNVEPLDRAAHRLPAELVAICRKGLSVDPAQRFQSAADFARALGAFERTTRPALTQQLADLVAWALDSKELARRIEVKVKDSVRRMMAVRALNSSAAPAQVRMACIRRLSGETIEDVPFPRVVELVTSGTIEPLDEISLMGEPFRKVREIPELARHFLPSTTALTGRFAGPGVPDYQALLAETPMLDVLAHLRNRRETGALFVQRSMSPSDLRKEIYLESGKLHHVASSDRNELLGEYLVRRGRLARPDLERALAALGEQGGQLGDTLIGMGLVGAVDLFRAIRDQGRDRVAALCAWGSGRATFYRGTSAQRVDFPLDLDTAHGMMAGVIVATQGEPRKALPMGSTRIVVGPRSAELADPAETDSAPTALRALIGLLPESLTVETMVLRLTLEPTSREGRALSQREACAGLAVAHRLGWVRWK